ncbi:MAG: hypothetical protein QOF27_1179 [Gaiellaceae bacterium]|nr:hypothetical protein [Gaiellaceae bacterium]
MENPELAPDPRDLLSRFRATYRNYFALSTTPEAVPEGVVLETPATRELSESDLPEGVRRLLEAYREAHREERIVLVKYMRLVDGTPEVVVEDESGLPPVEELVTLSQTVTLNTSDRVDVITDLFVARKT